jgi:predicted HNH restriction endonuclease
VTLERQRERKQEAINYKGGKCQLCGYDKYKGALEFHHIDPTKKDFALSAGRLTSLEKLKPELDKCVLLCANCHREVHAFITEPFEPSSLIE